MTTTHKKPALNDVFFQHGKVPPQAVDLEEVTLGAAMLEPVGMTQLSAIMRPEMFYKESHQMIFEAMLSLFANGQPVDILTVTEELRANGNLETSGGPAYIVSLTNRVSSASNVEYHAHIIIEKYIARTLIAQCNSLANQLFEDTADPLEAAETLASQLMDGFGILHKRKARTLGDITRQAAHTISEMKKNPKSIIGIPSGLSVLDEVTQGYVPGDLQIIAARPGMGKSALIFNMLQHIGVYLRVPVGVFEMEQTHPQIANRVISSYTGISHEAIRSGNIDDQQERLIESSMQALDAPVYIDDTPALNIIELRAKAIEMVRKYKVKILFIDYLQLMRGLHGRGESREQEISSISRGLKALAKELDVSVVALSQLSREVEKRTNRRPQLSDLRESGGIEQDADSVVFIFRPSYYKITDKFGEPFPDSEAWLIIDKNRHGGTCDVRVEWHPEQMKFTNPSDASTSNYEQYKDNDFF